MNIETLAAINAMSGVTVGIDQIEAILTYEISDEALEAAAGTGSETATHYTLYFCTALDLCPGP
jgi:hypothetical protein